jgi:hypothetical protein
VRARADGAHARRSISAGSSPRHDPARQRVSRAAARAAILDQEITGGREVAVRSFNYAGNPASAVARVSAICGSGYSEGRISVVSGASARYAAWSDLGLGHIVFATF